MKKIYSFMLLAAAMLLSISVNATTVNSASELQDALDAAGDGETIVVGQDFPIGAVIRINLGAKTVSLDLNGHTLSASGSAAITMFELYKGKLIVTGAGSIDNTGSTSGSPCAFKVFGTYEPVLPGNYTHLTIDENVQINVAGGASSKKGYGISINELSKAIEVNGETMPATTKLIYTRNTTTKTSNGFANGVRIDVKGDISMTSALGYCIKTNGNLLYAGNYVPHNNSETQALIGHSELLLDSTWATYAPFVKLHSTAYLHATATGTGAAAIYSSGYATFDIQCQADGATALFAKSGNITVTDAILTSTASTYQTTGSSGRSGVNSQGSAVVIESNAAYQGAVEITIAGDTKIEAQSGCAIEEVITTADNTHVSAIDIQGGSFESGSDPNAGCIKISEVTLAAAEDDDQVTEITIGGGSYTAQTEAQQAAAAALIGEIISHDTENPTYTSEVATGNGGTALVVSSGTAPVEVGTSMTLAELMALDDADQINSVDFSTLTADEEYVLSGDLRLKDILMNGEHNISIVIPNGFSMVVNKITMNDKANITVKAGGKLIVTGTQGIYAPTTDNILVEAVEGNMGLFLFNPAVVSNKHPNGTVQLVSQGYREGGQYVWQRFGVPAFEGMLKGDIVKVGHSYGTAYKYWNIELDDWANVAADQVMKPFQGFTMTTQTSAPGAKYGMPCELYGNVDAPLEYTPGWNYLANSYTAEIDIESFLQKILDRTEAIIEGAVQINTSSSDNLWKPISWADIEDDQAIQTKLFPMQCFITKLIIDVPFKDTISYETMIWNHRDEENVEYVAAAPARRNMQASDYTKAVIVIANGNNEQEVTLRQSAQFSDEFENGYDVTSYASAFNIYANAEVGNLAQIATDNLMGQTLSIESNKAATYKMTFKNLRGETLAIRDNMTGSVINMTEGEEYFFSVAPGTTADRFEIVEAAKMPTDVEALQAAPAKKGIYTLVGQYLGENFDVLPAGIYVVNGKKVVK